MKIKAQLILDTTTGKIETLLSPSKGESKNASHFIKVGKKLQQFGQILLEKSYRLKVKEDLQFSKSVKRVPFKQRSTEIIKGDQKHCPHCDKWKSFEEFFKDKNKPSGYSSWCKECVKSVQDPAEVRKRARVWYRKHKAQALAYQKQYAQKKKGDSINGN